MQYRKRPVVIEAFQWFGDENQVEDPSWILDAIRNKTVSFENERTPEVVMKIATPEGVMTAKSGDWIIKGIQGEIYPCKADIFEETYEKEQPGFSRRELWAITEKAAELAGVKGTNSLWSRVYLRLADAANELDAYIARSTEKK